MLHSQSDPAQGRADIHTPSPGIDNVIGGSVNSAASDPSSIGHVGTGEVLTLHDFLSRIAISEEARLAFEADPQAALTQAGLGQMSTEDVLQASSLVLDYAPVEVVEDYGRSLQSSVEKFAASQQYVAVNHFHPAHPHEEVTDMLQKPQPAQFDRSNDIDAQPAKPGNVHVEDSQANHAEQNGLINANVPVNVAPDVVKGNDVDVASDNKVLSGNEGGDSKSTALGVDNTVSSVTNTVGDVQDTAIGVVGSAPEALDPATTAVGDVAEPVTGAVDGLPVAGDVVGTVGDVAGNAPIVGDQVDNLGL